MRWVWAPFRFALAVWHALVFAFKGRPVLTPWVVLQHRARICEPCPNNIHGFCRLCNCWIDLKTRISSESCPDKPPRWKALTRADELGMDLTPPDG